MLEIAFLSLYRMTFAYILSLLFSFTIGYFAATNKTAERFVLPMLDILQSIPILGFFPVAIIFFISLSSKVGVELASIFLIFTSMSWNMILGVYESIAMIPEDISSAASIYGLKGWLKFKRIIFPATIQKLVYNSMISWAGGWYFLIASEIITAGSETYKLRGLGRFLMESAQRGEIDGMFLGISAIVLIIVALDILLWRPLSAWSSKFKYEHGAEEVKYGGRGVIELRIPKFLSTALDRFFYKIEKLLPALKILTFSAFLALTAYVSYKILRYIPALLTPPFPEDAGLIPAALIFSFGRLLAAYIISIAWTVPLAIYLAKNPVSKYIVPLIEIVAAIPATALFPFIVIIIIKYTNSMNIASILLALTGMQWYLFFNVLAGAKSIPEDLDNAAKVFGIKNKKSLYLKKISLPAIFPSLITGSITAWGGGWNALIVSEYVLYGGVKYYALGIGYLLDKATFEADSKMLALSLMAMTFTIIVMNRLFWRRLYNIAKKYKIEA